MADQNLLDDRNVKEEEVVESTHDEENRSRAFPTFVRNTDRVTTRSAAYAAMDFNQCVTNEGTDDELVCRGYRETVPRKILYYLLILCSAGLILLIFYWKPNWKILVTSAPCSIESATHLILRDIYKTNHVKTIKQLLPPNSSTNLNKADEISEDSFKNVMKDPSKPYCSLTKIVEQGLRQTIYFEHKFQKYLWNGETFLPLRGFDFDTTVRDLQEMGSGLSENEKPDRRLLFGLNSIAIEITPIFVLLFREIVHPFYAFQVFAIIVWCSDEYYSLPAVLIITAIISISLSLYLTRKQNRMINRMSSGSGKVRVLINGNFETRESTDLLPGDVIEIKAGQESLWCDCVLLSGCCVASESMLTGESVPVMKTALISDDPENSYYDQTCHRQHTLYSGTRILDVYPQHNEPPRAVVIRTGFYTEKGRMIESMLSPSPLDYTFYNDSLKFIFIMAMIGLLGCILTIFFLVRLQADPSHVVKRVLDLLTIIVPPGLPAAITISTIYAQRRLRKAKIYCISPPRIAISGKINCMCFDKTGTLTKNELQLWGILPCSEGNTGVEQKQSFEKIIHELPRLRELGSIGESCLRAIGSCHSLVRVDKEITGSPLDLELFRATKWNLNSAVEKWCNGCNCVLTSDDENNVKLAIARVFQFNSVMGRMSVVTKSMGENHLRVFTKGAPETVEKLCVSSSVPSDFKDKLQYFTRQGFRVLALATKEMDNSKNVDDLDRKSVESDLQFIGFIVLINPVKPRTTETIEKLLDVNIRTVMATGDNLETALHVARECKMLGAMDRVVTLKVKPSTTGEGMKLFWEVEPSDDDSPMINVTSFCADKATIETPRYPTYHLALTGDTLELIRTHSKDLFYRVLSSATVFARMKPDHKRHLVEGLQDMKYIVGMCGDGANDSGALKAAHAGIAIIETEASIVAPFTSLKKDISCCVKLIREGRAALVTSFGMMKFLCIYCIVQYMALIFLYTINSYLSDAQFLFGDIGVSGIVALFFAIGGASKNLSKRMPHVSLVSPVMVTCLLLQILILAGVQTASFMTLRTQSWHVPLEPNMTEPKDNIICDENTVIFLTMCFQDMMLAFIFYESLPHKERVYKNVPYFVGFLIMSIWVVVMFCVPAEAIVSAFSLTTLNNDIEYRIILAAFYVVNIAFAIIVEKVLLQSKSFERFLKKISSKFTRFRHNNVNADDENDYIHFDHLRRHLAVDVAWPPIGQETTLKT